MTLAILRRASAPALLLLLAGGAGLAAQQPRRQWEPRGFDFRPDGVWRRRARAVANTRVSLMRRRDFTSLNAAAGAMPNVVTGVLKVPVFLVRFKNTDTTTLPPALAYDSVLLGASAPRQRAYTVRTLYEEMSHGLMSVQGVVLGWIALDSNDSWYAGLGSCDGICISAHIAPLIKEAMDKVERANPTFDWGQFDADGDGVVDLLWVIQPKPGGECGYNGNIWAHRYYVSGWPPAFAPLTTHTRRPDGSAIVIDDYTIQSGVGGVVNAPGGSPIAGCDPSDIMAPGTVAHETGHGLGLPDLYDADPNDLDDSEGIGEWGLMGSGNWARQGSPAHMEAFSLARLGWVSVRPLTQPGSYRFGPVETGDTVFQLQPTVSNPRGEYFLLENRAGLRSDSAMIAKHGGGGLLIWHVDQAQYDACSLPFNCVNTGAIHGVALVQADGLDNLGSSTVGIRNRGDAGDAYPGSTGNTSFSLHTTPSATLNSDGGIAGFDIDSIVQPVVNGEITFRLKVASVVTVRASDSLAQIRVAGAPYARYQDLFANGDSLLLSVDSVQFSADSLRKFVFGAWSDGLARAHTVHLMGASTTLTAGLQRQYLVRYQVSGSGSVASAPVSSTSGSFLAYGDSVILTASAPPNKVFAGWSGDTLAMSRTLMLRVTRPWNVTASFISPVTEDAVVSQYVLRNGALAADQVQYLDRLGNNNGRLDIGDITAWLDQTGASPMVRMRVMARAR